MPIKILAAVIAIALMVAYVSPTVFKLKDIPLAVVVLIGVGMMLLDLWQSLQSKDD